MVRSMFCFLAGKSALSESLWACGGEDWVRGTRGSLFYELHNMHIEGGGHYCNFRFSHHVDFRR